MWPFSSPPRPHIPGATLTADDIRAVLGFSCIFGKKLYAQANSAAVIAIAKRTRDDLWKQAGITKWNPTATCTLFAARFATEAAEQYFEATWHGYNPAPALAIGDTWFLPANAGLNGHAIGVAMTEKGPLFIDPQVPEVLRPMTPGELTSMYHTRFL